jgi:membrane protein
MSATNGPGSLSRRKPFRPWTRSEHFLGPAIDAQGMHTGPLRARRASMTADASQTLSRSPAPAWRVRALRLYGNIGKHRVIAIAAGVTFYGLLAIFPALAALVSLYGLFADPASIAGHLDTWRACCRAEVSMSFATR